MHHVSQPAPITIERSLKECPLPVTEAQTLLASVLQVTSSFLLAHGEWVFDRSKFEIFNALVARRIAGEPIAYILGEKEFYGLMFKVTPAVLIPRPETELLIDLALKRLAKNEGFRLLDVGTGSGIIAITLAKYCPRALVTAIDISGEALMLAQENAKLHQVQIEFLESDLFSAVQTREFDLIISNPPYVAGNDFHLVQDDLRAEPRVALVSADGGMQCLQQIISQAKCYLRSEGWLLLEHGYDQAEKCHKLFRDYGFRQVTSWPDLAQILRVTGGVI